jgi:putative ABC transport system permease protein
MNFQENVREGMRAVQANLLRSILTALIIAIGIMALVGILTAVDNIQSSVNDSFADLGANSFDIEAPSSRGRRFGPGQNQKNYPPIKYRDMTAYKQNFKFRAQVSVSVGITGSAEAKYGSNKTNPNINMTGINENYLLASALDIEEGRDFSTLELAQGTYVAILGSNVAATLFDKQSPIDKVFTVRERKYRVVGILKSKGSSQGGSGDGSIFVPLENGRLLVGDDNATYSIKTLLEDATDFETAIGEATILMRRIRKDAPGAADSFLISRSETLAERLSSITGYLKLGGGVIGFITLLGASIGLMNIMMVSVTERTREIGVRKALGATPFRIRQQFLIEAIVICLWGGLFGIFFGILIGNGVSRLLGSDTFVIPWLWILTGLVVCVMVGIVSGFYPAYKASKLDPIESLRFE